MSTTTLLSLLLLLVHFGAGHKPANLPRCIDQSRPPCTVQGVAYYAISEECASAQGSNNVILARSDDSKVYALQFGIRSLSELSLTHRMSKLEPPRSVKVLNFEFDEGAPSRYVMVTAFHPRVGNVRTLKEFDRLSMYRDEHVFKFLSEMGRVLETLWRSMRCIDRDFHVFHVFLSGDLRHPSSTEYVKINYAASIAADEAVKELTTPFGRQFGFCLHGVNVEIVSIFLFSAFLIKFADCVYLSQPSPIDFRVMFGFGSARYGPSAVDQIAKQRDSADAAIELVTNLESNDLIDLVQAAVVYHDLLTINDADKTGLDARHHSMGEAEWARVIEHRRFVLEHRYNNSEWLRPEVEPQTVKQLLVKFTLLSYLQLPEHRLRVNSADYLNWNVFREWMVAVASHSYSSF